MYRSHERTAVQVLRSNSVHSRILTCSYVDLTWVTLTSCIGIIYYYFLNILNLRVLNFYGRNERAGIIFSKS